MPFGLTNIPVLFQHFINNVLSPFLNQFVTAYLHDILIYYDSLEEYQSYMLSVLEALSKVKLHLKMEKCKFHKQEIKYLGQIVGKDRVKIDVDKVVAVKD